MKLAFSILINCFLLLNCTPLHANERTRVLNDSTELFRKIKQNEQLYKQQKSRQLKKIETKDSVISYSSNKEHTQITRIMVINRKVESKTYWFINNKLFKITLFTLSKKNNGIKPNGGKSFYFIDDNKVFYKEETSITKDVEVLLTNANKLIEEGIKIL